MRNTILLICLLILVSITGCSTKTAIISRLSGTSESIDIKVDKGLLSDIRTRLRKLEQESLMPFNVSDTTSNPSIIVTFDNSTIPADWTKEKIYEKNVQLSPDSFQASFKEKNSASQVIYYGTKDKNSIIVKDFLNNSYSISPPSTTRLTFVGDIMLDRYVSYKSKLAGDFSYPFLQVNQELNTADLTIANLESPFSETGPYLTTGMTFRTDPQMVSGLNLSGIDAVSLANNHFGNASKAGMESTFKILDDNHIGYFGAGENIIKSHLPLIKEINGTKFGFLGYTDQDLIPSSYLATDNNPGVSTLDKTQLTKDITEAKKQVDFLIVSYHMGTEYAGNPNVQQKEYAHLAIDNGADMVYGHHSHVIQGMEMYKNKPVFYSLGNFVFDQTLPNTKDGLVVNMEFSYGQPVSYQLQTIKIANLSQPYFPSQEDQESVLDKFYTSSSQL